MDLTKNVICLGNAKNNGGGNSDLSGKANINLDNITNEGKQVIRNVFLKETITIDNVAEIEFTNLNDGYQHHFEFIDFAPSVASYMLCQVGNNGSYFNNEEYMYSCLMQNSNTSSNWISDSKYGYGSNHFKLTPDNISAWNLQPNKNSFVEFNIISDFSKNGMKLFEGKCLLSDFSTKPYLISNTFRGLLNINGIADRVKFYLSSGNFASGIIKHYIY